MSLLSSLRYLLGCPLGGRRGLGGTLDKGLCELLDRGMCIPLAASITS